MRLLSCVFRDDDGNGWQDGVPVYRAKVGKKAFMFGKWWTIERVLPMPPYDSKDFKATRNG